MKFVFILLVIIYLAIGVVVDAVSREEWQPPSFLIWLLWPILVAFYLLALIITLLEGLGRKLKDKFKL